MNRLLRPITFLFIFFSCYLIRSDNSLETLFIITTLLRLQTEFQGCFILMLGNASILLSPKPFVQYNISDELIMYLKKHRIEMSLSDKCMLTYRIFLILSDQILTLLVQCGLASPGSDNAQSCSETLKNRHV